MVEVEMEDVEDLQHSNSEAEDGNSINDEEIDKAATATEVTGWADSIAKILRSNRPKNKKELILSRARKDYEVTKVPQKSESTSLRKRPRKNVADDLEIVPLDSKKAKSEADSVELPVPAKDKVNSNSGNDLLNLKAQRKLELKQKKLELAWENLSRISEVKSDPLLERDLVKVATRGVVQLFNAISSQQKTIKNKLRSDEVSKSEFKRDKVLSKTKEIFEDAMTKNKTKSKVNEVEIKEEDSDDDGNHASATTSKKKKKAWSALQDDFMLDAKLKDWDKEDSSSDGEGDSDDDSD